MNIERIGKGFIAGFAATVALSALMIAKSMMGMLPQFSAIALNAGAVGQSGNLLAGWIVHFVIGAVVWGILFAFLVDILPGAYWLKGVVFGLLAWLAMSLLYFPFLGEGLFGVSLAPMVPVATAVLHIIYGAVLGAVYGAMTPAPQAVS